MTAAGPAVGVLRTADASGLGAVERELASLHKAMLRAGGDEARAVRLSVLTLVVACNDDASADRAAEVVATVAAEHPARALLVVARRDAPDGIEAQLRLECSIRGGPETHVCAEIVHLRVGGAPALHLASVVQPLLLADVPVQLWLAGGPPLVQALAPDTLSAVERVIVDSDEYQDAHGTLRMCAAAASGTHGAGVPVVDLAWLRLEPWREALARAFDAPARRALLRRVVSAAVSGTAPASAWLAAGWLATRLRLDDSAITVDVSPAAGPAEAAIRSLRVTAGSPDTLAISVRREDGGLVTEAVAGGAVVDTRSVPSDSPSTSELVGLALQEAGDDAVYAQALARAAVMAG